jgi:osmoprotectant transport system permease protein
MITAVMITAVMITDSSLLATGNPADAFIWWEWITRRPGEIWQRTVEHLQMTVVAVSIGCLISAGLTMLALRHQWTITPITWIGSLLYTIPSLALFVFLIPYTGLGFVTAQIALVSYTIQILFRNMVAGIQGVPAAVTEAATAMGYRRLHRLWAVELPLAAPTIIAGIRIAAVTVIGLVTITALIGNGGYGAFINDGLNRRFSTPIVLGGGLSVVMALLVDAMLMALQKAVTPWSRRPATTQTFGSQ